jgi:alcohol dehydrogenase class IV
VIVRWSLDVPSVRSALVGRALARDRRAEVDSLLAIGGGSAIDTAKNASSQTGLPLVSVPTTYSQVPSRRAVSAFGRPIGAWSAEVTERN